MMKQKQRIKENRGKSHAMSAYIVSFVPPDSIAPLAIKASLVRAESMLNPFQTDK